MRIDRDCSHAWTLLQPPFLSCFPDQESKAPNRCGNPGSADVTPRETILVSRLLAAVTDYRSAISYTRASTGAPARERLTDLAATKARRESALDIAIQDLLKEMNA